jgi:hypothetical protein
MAALGVVSSLARVTGKVITGATGELVLWQGCQVATSWRCSHVGMSMYGDLLDNAGGVEKMQAIRGGLEAMETVSVMPVSLVSSLKGFQSGKILRKSMHDA